MVTSTTVPREIDSTETRINQLLNEAHAALEKNRLTTPKHDNAYDRYLAVLSLEADNPEALDGINAIVEKYLSWAMDNAEQGKLSRARQYVAKAELIDKSHPNIRPAAKMINDLEDKTTTVFQLDPVSVRNKQATRIEFARIAGQIQLHHAFVIIRAANDVSGRWLYQELTQRVDYRIEARFEHSNSPSISLVR